MSDIAMTAGDIVTWWFVAAAAIIVVFLIANVGEKRREAEARDRAAMRRAIKELNRQERQP